MKLILTISLFVSYTSKSHAFVENVTHGYPNCMSCHISPAGGDLLSDYGRSLSKELMSTWGWKNSEAPAFGLVKNSPHIKWGGDYRSIQTYSNNNQLKQGKQFTMQKNIEVGVQYSNLWFVAALGTQEGPKGTPKKDKFLSERHYLLWHPSEETKIRLGKFRLNFGLNDPNHTRLTKQQLGFGSNSESYIFEFSRFSEKDELFISADLGRIDIPRNSRTEKSISSTYSRYVSEKSKIGASLLFGESGLKRRSIAGLNGVIGVTDKALVKYEVDVERSVPSSAINNSQYLLAGNLVAGYQIYRGILPYGISEFSKQDLRVHSAKRFSYGMGFQLLPIPHVEIQMELKKLIVANSSTHKSTNGWVVLHLYL